MAYQFFGCQKAELFVVELSVNGKGVNKGTTQGSDSGPYLFSLFLNDLEVDQTQESDLIKYANDWNIILSIVRKNSWDKSEIAGKRLLEWTYISNMNCNT